MKLYWFKAQAPQRVLALAKHLGLAPELVKIDAAGGGLKAPDYLALNPNAKAPTLVDGDLVLWESAAIMAHMCMKAGSDMWPVNSPAEQVDVLRWLVWSDSQWSPAVGPFYFEHIIKAQFGMGPPDAAALEKAGPPLRKQARVLNRYLETSRHVACGRLTIADFHLAAMASYWRNADMPFVEFPNIVTWLDGLEQIPAWADPWPAE
ncbi:glutathione S-transferase family protein [bacterium]|nr:glutathione S-transferase family protein [bacterium]